eukprot:CAMPEP_0201634628 /NCGR_PEP_ID=MMETSP0493-20130528/7479_1 /ASSEMBLY_ACC=CAM_ASM_000838 /TAXON_ID=420259 /ORGANISM="Thalassiosira gravida, Strain GMp14c1" /LENGTH=344 /DNA_ID=CAMNT_0048106497 /DNA_START=81 /DNA_END=1112 /DNA_ORIENTATION=+
MSPLYAIASLLLAISIPAEHKYGLPFSDAFQINDRHYCSAAYASARAARARDRAAFSSTAIPAITTTVTASTTTTTQIFNSKKENDEKTSSSTMTLNFVGEAVYTSKPAPMIDVNNNNNQAKSLHAFFALPQSAILLLRGSKNNQVVELESVDEELLKRYRQSCDSVNALPPTSDDRFYEVTTSGVKFPGLTVMTAVTIGVKVTTQEDLPGYEFVLIKDSTYAEGNRLFVWFFNKATGKDNEDNVDDDNNKYDDHNQQSTFSMNKISVVVPTTTTSTSTENNTISFESNPYLRVQVQFPSFLMKAIPGATKKKSEKTGSDAMRKVLDADGPVALEAFQQEYVRW